MEDDSRFEWVSPDEGVRRPFRRGRRDALALAARWDLCVSGEGLQHLHHVGADVAYVPLTQARAGMHAREHTLVSWPAHMACPYSALLRHCRHRKHGVLDPCQI